MKQDGLLFTVEIISRMEKKRKRKKKEEKEEEK
jgi:hypothetical protein